MMGREFVEHRLIVRRLHHDCDIVMIFSSSADHRRSADVDILDAVFLRSTFIDRRLERIKIDHQQIDGRDAVILHRFRVIGIVANCQQSAMYIRMQRLDAAIHHFRKSR